MELLDFDTNRRFLTARQFDPDAALKQLQEACQFRYKKHILRLYDLVDIADYEQSRRFVSGQLIPRRQLSH